MQYSNLAMRMFCSTYGRRCLSATNRHRLRFSESVSPTYRFLRAHGKPQISGQYLAGFKSSRVKAMAGADEDLLTTLKARGLFDNCTDESGLRDALQLPIKIYCGFDPTADSLHLGNLLGIIILSWFQRAGHQPVILVGGATGSVGDPSGRSQERPLLDEQTLSANVSAICDSIESILKRNGGHGDTTVLNNYDWFKDISLLGFLRDTGKFARLGTMLSKDSVRKRLESEDGLSFTEFTYQLLQGYDFLHLFRNEDVRVQVGGSDQWGNITAGTELIRRVIRVEGAYGLTFPLLLKSDGTKFGKSASGAVWLSKEKLTPYHFYQYLLNTSDSDVVTLLRMLTFLPLDHIERIEQDMSTASYIPNTAQQILATEVTRFVHGSDGLQEATKATASLRPGTDTVLDADALKLVSDTIPSATLSRSDVIDKPIVDVVASSGLLESKGAAKRMIRNGGIRVNNMKITDESKTISQSDIVGDNMVLLAAGKKNKLLLMLQ